MTVLVRHGSGNFFRSKNFQNLVRNKKPGAKETDYGNQWKRVLDPPGFDLDSFNLNTLAALKPVGRKFRSSSSSGNTSID
jgi:hypothetical protein